MTKIATHAIVITLKAALMIDMTTGTMIASQPLVIEKAKATMPNTTTNLDQGHDQNQGPVLMTLKPQDTIMVTKFMMITIGEGNKFILPLLSLV